MAALASVSVLIAAGVGMNFNFNTGGVIAAYAQPTNSRACPEDFTLIRGKCEMEPEITTELVCPNNLAESPQGNCIVGTTSISNAICPNSHPFLHLDGKCRNAEGEIGNLVYQCQPGQEFDDSDLPNNPRCFVVIPKVEQEVQEPCPDGSTLDTARNLCVTKPGRSNNNNN